MKMKIAIATVAALALVPLAACTGNGTTSDPEPGITAVGSPEATAAETQPAATQSADASAPAETQQAPSSDVVAGSLEDAETARDLALAHVAAEAGAEGVVIEQDLDDDGRSEWDVDVFVADRVYKVDVDTAAGTARTDEIEDADDDDRDAAAATVTIGEAIEAALAHTPGTLDDASWDDDDDKGWEIEIDREGGGDVELKVDPNTAEVRQS